MGLYDRARPPRHDDRAPITSPARKGSAMSTIRERRPRWNGARRSGGCGRDAPVALARLLPCGCCVEITCPLCGRRHTHSKVSGHRVAHCLNAPPGAGYVLRRSR